MTLLGKILQTEDPHFRGHAFEAIFVRWCNGDYTRPRTITELESMLDGGTLGPVETDALDEMKAFFDALPNKNQEQDYLHGFGYKVVLAQFGHITRATFKAEVGITSET